MNPIELVRRFTYHKLTSNQPKQYEQIRDLGHRFADVINGICPDNREKSVAITKIEEAVMWANASIARGDEVDHRDKA